MEISFTPSSAAWISIAVAAPPAPQIVIFFPITSFTIVLTAPHISAAGDSSSRYCPTTVLFGIETLDPTIFKARSPLIASSSVLLSTSNAR